MRTWRYSLGMRALAWTAMLSVGGLELSQAPAQAMSIHTPKPWHVCELKPGLTQTPDAAQFKKILAKQAALQAGQDCRPLTPAEMKNVRGRGNPPYRVRYYAGTFPWHRSFRNVNLCNGDLFLSFTDIQVAPAKGAGLALQRTYNSEDDTIGPFGLGWTHAYDIRLGEEGGTANLVDRKDFFGAFHRYHRDADGLYTPPAYLYDELSSGYEKFLVSASAIIDNDTDIGMDGTIKHYNAFGSTSERVCDYIQDRYGNRTNLSYQQAFKSDGSVAKNLLQTVTDPSGRTLNFHWTNFGSQDQPIYRIDSAWGSNGLAYMVQYIYGADYNLSSVTLDPSGLNRTTSFTYTSFSGANGTESGLLNTITDPLNHTVSYTYAAPTITVNNQYTVCWLWVASVTEPAGIDSQGHARTTTWTITPGWTAVSNYNSYYTTVSNNDTGLSINQFMDNRLRATSYNFNLLPFFLWGRSYDSAYNVLTTSEDYGRDAPEKTDNYTYGQHGNVLTHTVTGYPGTDTYTYGNASQYFQKLTATDRNGHTSTFIVGDDQGNDPSGMVPQSTGNKGSILHVQDAGYNDSSSPSYQKQYTYYYNSIGQKIKEINLNGVETDYTYGDSWGNLTQVVQDPGTGHLNKTTSMVYDINGRVQNSTDANSKQSSFSYNNLGQPLTASFPATTNTPAEVITYGYGGNGRTQTVSDNRGITAINYEAGCDRVSSVSDPVTGFVSYTYGITGERLSLTLPGAQQGWGSFTYTYGSPSTNYGMLAKDDPNCLSPQLLYQKDDQGREVEYCNLSPTAIDYSGHLHQMRSNETYNQSNSLVSYQETDYTYELTNNNTATSGRLASIVTTYNQWVNNAWQQTKLLENDYTYDNAGQRLANKFTYSDNSTRTETYTYDDVNRLSTVNYGDGQTQSYTFDAMGNRASKNDSVNGNESYTVNAANMLLSRGSNSYTNDANGNTLTGGGRTNVWDSENRLASCVNGANTCTYTYGSDGIRHQSVVNGVTTDFVLDASMFVRELRNGSSIATYLMGPRGPEYRRDDTIPGGSVRWYVYDGLGSVVEEVDPSGNITASRKYDVYGSVRSSAGNSTSKHRFIGSLGHTSEDETGLIYMRARYMDPAIGRFINEDPGKQGDNFFVYCNDNPINSIDANGEDPMWADYLVNLIRDALMSPEEVQQELAIALYAASLALDASAKMNRRLASQQFGAALNFEADALGNGVDLFSKRLSMEAAETLFQAACKSETSAVVQMFLAEQLRDLSAMLGYDGPMM